MPLVVAYSGGGDSLALLALACDHFASLPVYARPVHALIVDHGLRAESAQEAQQAAINARALGAKAEVLRWDAPRSGQHRARTARYRLLAEACRTRGADTLFLAHTKDDQDETFALRLGRGSSARGLACMSAYAPLPLWPDGQGLSLARPLLGFTRTELRLFLQERELSWIEDPSNRDRRYARVRARAHLAALREAGLADNRLGHSIAALSALENERRRQARNLIAKAAQLHPAGFALLQKHPFAAAPHAIRLSAIGAVMAGVSGTGTMPAIGHTLGEALAALSEKKGSVLSAAGCRVDTNGETILISRDRGAVVGRSAQANNCSTKVKEAQAVIFDGRFEMVLPKNGHLESLENRARALPLEQYEVLQTLPVPVRPLVPVFIGKKNTLSSPILSGVGASFFLAPHIIERILAPIWHNDDRMCE